MSKFVLTALAIELTPGPNARCRPHRGRHRVVRRGHARRLNRTITAFDTGVLLPSAVEPSGTSTFASG